MSNELASEILFAERYLLKKLIGEGGIGQVWLAEDTLEDNRQVALKLPRPEYRTQASFIAEAELMASFEHENIIKIFEMGFNEAYGEYYAMEYFPSGSLIDYMALPECKFAHSFPGAPDVRYVPLKQAIQILQPIARALDYVHQNHEDVLHRDLKLSNILVDAENDRYVLTDFSLHVGAPSIMSPEQLLEWRGPGKQRQSLDWRSDLFAFGACIYKLTTGTYPFIIRNAPNSVQAIDELYRYQLIDKIPVTEPRFRNPHNPDLQNEKVNALIWQLTSKSRTGRTLNGQITKLEDALDLLTEAAQVKRSVFTPLVAFLILVVGLLLLAGGIYYGTSQTGQPPPQAAAPVGVESDNPGHSSSQAALAVYPSPTPTTTPPPTETPPPAEEPTVAEPTEPPPEDTPTVETAAPSPEETPAEEAATPEPPPLECDAGLELLNPLVNQQVSGEVIFKGIVAQNDLDYYKVEFLPPGSTEWSCCIIEPTSGQVNPEDLGSWDTSKDRFVPGEYGIRLVAVKLDGNFTVCESRVTLEKQ